MRVNETKFLLYFDILGFGPLADAVGERAGVDPRKVRADFVSCIDRKVQGLRGKGRIMGVSTGRDDWLLVTDDLQRLYTCVAAILDHDTGYRDQERIPLEIALGSGTYDKWTRFEGTELVAEQSTLQFLKSRMIAHYHEWHKRTYDNRSPTSSFLIVTEPLYHELDHLEKKACQPIEYRAGLFYVMSIPTVVRRGRMYEFLERIGYPGNRWYGRIDEVYVPPREYEAMSTTLRERRMLFIAGSPEYGKTYTAVRFLWEYYNRGYEPIWVKGGERIERAEVRKKFENIAAELRPKHIIYFEDPFGKVEYERREGLEREIGTITDLVKHAVDVFVVTTSREEVFKEFKKERLSAPHLEELERRLTIGRRSYGYDERTQILLRWAEEENCRWLKDDALRDHILRSLRDETTLPTPLSIRSFTIATSGIADRPALEVALREKSEETAKAFAREISAMSDDKILFLSPLFVTDRLPVASARTIYVSLVRELNLHRAWDFERIVNWFRDDKVNVGPYVQFSHSSYSEALGYVLGENGHTTRVSERILSKLLLMLCEMGAGPQVATVLVDHYGRLPEKARRLLFELCEDPPSAFSLVFALSANFDRLPVLVRNRLLLRLSEKDRAASYAAVMAEIVAQNYDRLPGSVRDLLFRFCQSDRTAWGVPKAIVEHYHGLPQKVRDLLFVLRDREEAATSLAESIAENYDSLPRSVQDLLDEMPLREIIRDLSEEYDGRRLALLLISRTHARIGLSFSLEILDKLAKSWEVGEEAANLKRSILSQPQRV